MTAMVKKYPIPIWIAVGSVALCSGVRAEPEERPDQNPQGDTVGPAAEAGWALKDSKQATGKAREIFGVPPGREARVSAELVTLAKDNTPFLNKEIIKRPLWRVVVKDWTLRLPTYEGEKDKYLRTFDVLLDPVNGQVLKIISRWPEGVPAMAPEPCAASAEDQMRRSGEERYHAFPGSPPGISFLQALDCIDDSESPLAAKQIVAVYVMWSDLRRKPQPVWAITLRGIPPMPAGYPGVVPEAQRDHIRYIVDPESKRWLGATTCPQPDSRCPRDE